MDVETFVRAFFLLLIIVAILLYGIAQYLPQIVGVLTFFLEPVSWLGRRLRLLQPPPEASPPRIEPPPQPPPPEPAAALLTPPPVITEGFSVFC